MDILDKLNTYRIKNIWIRRVYTIFMWILLIPIWAVIFIMGSIMISLKEIFKDFYFEYKRLRVLFIQALKQEESKDEK